MQNFMQTPFEFEFFFHDGHQDIDTDRDPNLCVHRVRRGAEKGLNAEMLFEPLKE